MAARSNKAEHRPRARSLPAFSWARLQMQAHARPGQATLCHAMPRRAARCYEKPNEPHFERCFWLTRCGRSQRGHWVMKWEAGRVPNAGREYSGSLAALTFSEKRCICGQFLCPPVRVCVCAVSLSWHWQIVCAIQCRHCHISTHLRARTHTHSRTHACTHACWQQMCCILAGANYCCKATSSPIVG